MTDAAWALFSVPWVFVGAGLLIYSCTEIDTRPLLVGLVVFLWQMLIFYVGGIL